MSKGFASSVTPTTPPNEAADHRPPARIGERVKGGIKRRLIVSHVQKYQ